MAEVYNRTNIDKDPKHYKITFRKIVRHLGTILVHKFWVFIFCCKAGIPLRGLTHDLSKFSFTEFFTNAKYVEKGISPIDVQKQILGYTPAWFHHRGRNSHHYEYWMDKFDNGGYTTRMPFIDTLECICDMLAANRVYNGKSDDEYEKLWNFWKRKRNGSSMHPDNVLVLNHVFTYIRIYKNLDWINKNEVKSIYDNEVKLNKRPVQMKISEATVINRY